MTGAHWLGHKQGMHVLRGQGGQGCAWLFSLGRRQRQIHSLLFCRGASVGQRMYCRLELVE